MRKTLLLILVALLSIEASAQAVTSPKGQPRAYSHNAYISSDSKSWGWVAGLADTVYFDGKDVYFKDFVYLASDGCYLKGTITSGDSHNGTIEIPFGQESTSYNFEIYQLLPIGTKPNALTLTISNDTIRQENSNLAVVAYYGDDDTYTIGYASRVSFIPLPDGGLPANPNAVPDGAELQHYSLKVGSYGSASRNFAGVKDVYFHGNDVYITSMGGATVKGTRNGDKINISMPSYLGLVKGLYTYLNVGYIYMKDSTPYYGLITEPSTLTLNYDASTGTISCDTVLLISNGNIATIAYYYKPSFEKFDAPHYSIPASAKNISYLMTKKDVYGKRSSSQTNVFVAQDGDDFYFRNLSNELDDTCAMKGTLMSDGKIHVKLPQYVGLSQQYDAMSDGYVEVKYYVGAGKITSDYYFAMEPDQKEVTFSYDAATGKITGEGMTILFSADANLSDALYQPEYEKAPDVAVVPDDAETSSYVYSTTPWTFNRNRTSARISRSGNDFYFQDFDAEWFAPETEIIFKGTLNEAGNQIIVPVPQYVGGTRTLYLHSATANLADSTYSDVDKGGQVVFNYDAATGTISSDALLLLVKLNGSTDAPYEQIYKPSFIPYTPQDGTPVAPIITDWSFRASWGQYVMKMYLPEVDTEGHFLNPDLMTYRVYFDGSTTPYTFLDDTYEEFGVDIVDIPFRYTGASFGLNFADERLRDIWLYDSPQDSIGLQVTYHFGGQQYDSDITWFNINGSASGIASPSDAAAVVRREYYDLSGRRAEKNAKGVLIEKTLLKDGSVKSHKIIK